MTIYNLVLMAIVMALLIAILRLIITHKRKLKQILTDNENLKSEIKQEKLKRKEVNQHEINEVFTLLVHQSPNAIMLMDKDANILYINEGFEDMYEFNYESFTRQLGSNYRQTSFNSSVDERLEWVKANKLPYRYEALNVTRTGKELWTQTALMPILDENGEVTHFVTIDTDINDRIQKSDLVIAEMEALYNTVDKLSHQYKKLSIESGNLFNEINELYQLLEKTDSILEFIKQISDETRILGFNASIEASRAGTYGAGFKVITNKIVEISKSTIESVAQINNTIISISEKQEDISIKKDHSLTQMKTHEQILSELKSELEIIQESIVEFKSLA